MTRRQKWKEGVCWIKDVASNGGKFIFFDNDLTLFPLFIRVEYSLRWLLTSFMRFNRPFPDSTTSTLTIKRTVLSFTKATQSMTQSTQTWCSHMTVHTRILYLPSLIVRRHIKTVKLVTTVVKHSGIISARRSFYDTCRESLFDRHSRWTIASDFPLGFQWSERHYECPEYRKTNLTVFMTLLDLEYFVIWHKEWIILSSVGIAGFLYRPKKWERKTHLLETEGNASWRPEKRLQGKRFHSWVCISCLWPLLRFPVFIITRRDLFSFPKWITLLFILCCQS